MAESSDDTPLLTTGRIAALLGVSLPRVQRIIATRTHIRHTARAGTLRLFDAAAVELIRTELQAIDDRRSSGMSKRLGVFRG